MTTALLLKIRALVKAGRVFVSGHAKKELREDDLSPFDLEHVLATGFLSERQRDEASGEWKYVVEGAALDGDFVAVVVKVGTSDTLYVITVYRLHP